MKNLKLFVPVSVMCLSLILPSQAVGASAASKPRINWKVSSLASSTVIATSAIASSNSTGAKKWSVSGSCTLSKGKIKTKATGYCTVKVSIKARGKFAAGTGSKRFSIVRSVTTVPGPSTTQAPTNTGTQPPISY
jgi:hypothetical protein